MFCNPPTLSLPTRGEGTRSFSSSRVGAAGDRLPLHPSARDRRRTTSSSATAKDRNVAVTSAEEGAELRDCRLRRLLGEVVAAVDRAARHLGRAVLPPDRQWVVPAGDFALGAPQHVQRTLH